MLIVGLIGKLVGQCHQPFQQRGAASLGTIRLPVVDKGGNFQQQLPLLADRVYGFDSLMGSSSFLAFGRDELRAHVVLDNRMFLIQPDDADGVTAIGVNINAPVIVLLFDEDVVVLAIGIENDADRSRVPDDLHLGGP